MTALPLSRFTVLDLTRVRAGPTAVRQLADWGANVIKIEAPASSAEGRQSMGGARHGPDFQNLHRNKRSLALNLKHEDGVAVFRKLAATADVVVENYRPDVKNRLGIDYESLKAINPGIVYASISGFGQTGPYVQRPGVDQIAQGMGGLMSITGLPGHGPVRVGIPIADLTSGLYCAIGVLVALLEREVSGQGQWVQASLLQAQISMLDFQAARWLMAGDVPGQAGNNHPTSIPTGVYPTADGHINIAAAGDKIFERLCTAIGTPDLATRPEYIDDKNRSDNRDDLNARISEFTVTQTSAHWVEVLNEAGVPCGPINNIREVFEDPQVQHLGMSAPVHHEQLGDINILGQGVKLSRTPFNIRQASPDQGEHSDQILREAGYDDDAITALRNNGTI